MGKTHLFFVYLSLMLTGALSCQNGNSVKADFSRIESGFKTIPDSIQTSVYWYWISDNISREGVIRDLHSMKKAGINRAFIGNIGLNDVPYGKVKMLSVEWWEIVHAALKTATALNIEIGIFNSPGWSQSGGPWVGTGEAMRYLASSELRVTGPQKLSVKLHKPNDIFQDVKVIAFPVQEDDRNLLTDKNGKVTSSTRSSEVNRLFDGDTGTGIPFPGDSQLVLDLHSPALFTARSLSITTNKEPMLADAIFQTKDQNGNYGTISGFTINRSNPALNVGFIPYAPVVISFPATVSSDFRLRLKNRRKGGGIAEVELSSIPRVERFSEKTLAKMHPTPLPYWADYLWREQPEAEIQGMYIDPLKVRDITESMASDGTLNWEVPEGEWMIIRTGMTPTGTKNSPASPEATGYEVDKMSKKHVEKHFYGHMGEFLKRIPEADRNCFKVVVQDSYEMGGQNFTDDFLDEFKAKYGYDPLPYLPVYFGRVVGSQKASDRFLWDLRRIVADKVAYDYVGGLRDISHQYGLHTWLECYGHWGFPGEFLMYGGQSDEIGGEFWSEGELGDIENRAATSCGHIYGKTKISAESNTCAGRPFSRYPAVIKQRGDRFFAEGINNTLLHVYISQPYEEKNPGINAWFGNEFNRKNTWFSQLDVYLQYLKRTNFMLQQGLNVADVAYFIGEDAPKMTGITDPPLPVGYQFDYMNAEVLLRDMTVKNGWITLPHGTQYRILVLPKLETMRPEVLAKIRQLVFDGAVVLGPAPKRSPSLQNQPQADEQVATMARELWGGADGVANKSRRFGKGMILSGLTMTEAFDLLNCPPDCKLQEDNSVHYGHRTTGTGEIYFLTNQTDKTQEFTPEFRVAGLQPELWEATSGSVRKLPAFTRKGKTTAVPLKLEPFESVFIVFRDKAMKASEEMMDANFPAPSMIAELNGPWTVSFDTAMRGPDQPVIMETLKDWTTFDDDRIKYYSGTAFYRLTFHLGKWTEDQRMYINLGNLTAMAKVTLNGKYAGGVWTKPYRLDVTEMAKEGRNDLQIEVVSTWLNRLIGDSRLPADKRLTWCPVNPYKPDDPLQPSGLFGPVQMVSYNYQAVR